MLVLSDGQVPTLRIVLNGHNTRPRNKWTTATCHQWALEASMACLCIASSPNSLEFLAPDPSSLNVKATLSKVVEMTVSMQMTLLSWPLMERNPNTWSQCQRLLAQALSQTSTWYNRCHMELSMRVRMKPTNSLHYHRVIQVGQTANSRYKLGTKIAEHIKLRGLWFYLQQWTMIIKKILLERSKDSEII